MRAPSHRRYGGERPLGDVFAGLLWALVTAFHPAGQGRTSSGEALASRGSVGPASPPREGRVAQAWPTEGSGVGRLAAIAPRVAVSAGRLL